MRMILAATLAIMPLLAKDSEPVKRLDEATVVFSEIMATPDKGIPQDMLANAHCTVIVPGLKTAAFLVGGKYGKGYVSCRNKGGSAGRRLIHTFVGGGFNNNQTGDDGPSVDPRKSSS